jgi:hypothetical protein
MEYGQARGVKLYYTIHDVLELPGIDIVRVNMMEKAFPEFIQPEKNRAHKRVYKYREYLYIQWIQEWLEIEVLSIEEIRSKLVQLDSKKIPKRPKNGQFHRPDDFGVESVVLESKFEEVASQVIEKPKFEHAHPLKIQDSIRRLKEMAAHLKGELSASLK